MYLLRCLTSLSNILCSEMEILCIDDGSTDSSWKICKEYARIDNRIKVFSQQNAGPMAARNRGLEEATGEYICFVDSDDWIDPIMPLYFIQKMDRDLSVDVCISGVVRDYPDGSEQEIFWDAPEWMYTGEEAWKEMFLNKVFFWYMWGKVYRKDVIDGVHVDESVLTGEDLEFNWELFRKGKVRNVWYSPKYKYHYFVNSESLTEGVGRLRRRQSDLKVFKKILSAQDHFGKNVSEIVKMYALQTFYDIMRELCFRGIGDQKFEEYVIECRRLAFDINGKNVEDIEYVNRIRDLTKNVTDVKKYFLDVFEGVKKTIAAAMPVEKCRVSYVYGTGIVAGYVVELMEGILDYKGHVVSNGQPCIKRFRGKPVFLFSQIPENSILILAMNRSNQEKVLCDLKGDHYVIRLPIPDGF